MRRRVPRKLRATKGAGSVPCDVMLLSLAPSVIITFVAWAREGAPAGMGVRGQPRKPLNLEQRDGSGSTSANPSSRGRLHEVPGQHSVLQTPRSQARTELQISARRRISNLEPRALSFRPYMLFSCPGQQTTVTSRQPIRKGTRRGRWVP